MVIVRKGIDPMVGVRAVQAWEGACTRCLSVVEASREEIKEFDHTRPRPYAAVFGKAECPVCKEVMEFRPAKES